MYLQIEHYLIIHTIILILVGSSIVFSIQSIAGYATENIKQMPPLFIVSTRDNPSFDLKDITKLVNNSITKFNGPPCPDIVIYIHGFDKDKDDAGEEFNRIQMSLKNNSYTFPLVGFSWDSKVDWKQAKNNAKDSGGELAKFIYEFKQAYNCQNSNIHIIAHSLGAAVVENTLENLDIYLQSNMNNNNSKIINSVHLLGAAIDNQLVGTNTSLGKAIEHVVDKFYNLYSSEDEGLKINQVVENHNPLGLAGAMNVTKPLNYYETNIKNKIPSFSDADGDGNLEECFENIQPALVNGSNHCGYIGFREPFSNLLRSDGVIDVVVKDLGRP